MNLCFVLTNVSDCGGTERVCLKIASALSAMHNVHILSLKGNGIAYFEHSASIHIHNLQNRIEAKLYASHPKLIIQKLCFFFTFHHFDIVIDTCLMNSNLTLPALRGKKTKHLVWSNFSYEYFRRVGHEQVALNRIKEAGSHLLVLTKADRKAFIEEQGFCPERIHQIYNPLTFEVGSYTPHESKKILSIGRFAPEKGFDMLIRAWKIVEDQVPEWTFEIWGDTGVDTGNVRSTFAEEKPTRLTLHPAVKNIQEKYKEAAFYVMSSRHEGFPLVLLEALSYSLPIVSFDCPNGPREIVEDRKNGILVESENVMALADAIVSLIDQIESRQNLEKEAFASSKKYLMENILPQWECLLNAFVQESKQ